MKKILFLHHNSLPGGAELSFFELVCNLSDRIEPLCVVSAGGLGESLSAGKIHTVILPLHGIVKSFNPFYLIALSFNIFSVAFSISSICRKERISLMHANTLTGAVYCMTASFFCSTPFSYHERDLRKHRFLTPLVAKFAKKIIAVSDAVAENLKNFIHSEHGRKKITRIYNGVDIGKFSKENNSKKLNKIAGVSISGKNTVLMPAQFAEWKNHMDFIRVAALVKKEIKDTVFIFAGDNSRIDSRHYIKKLKSAISAENLDNDFLWTGFVDDMPALMRKVDCLVLPSVNEPFGRVVVEAMAAGTPVAAVGSGAIPEIIEDGVSGFIAPPGECAAMAEYVCCLLKDKKLSEKIAKCAKLRVSQIFSLKDSVKYFEREIYESCL